MNARPHPLSRAELVLRRRTFDAGKTQHFPRQKLHQEPDSRDACPLRHDEHVERHWRRSIVRQDRFEPSIGKQIVHQPEMRRAYTATGKIGFPRGKP